MGAGAPRLVPALLSSSQAFGWRFALPGGSAGEESACNAGDPGSIPGSEEPLEK